MRSVLTWFLAAVLTPSAWSAIEVHVAADGNDRNPGTVAQPIATLQQAQRIVRSRGPGRQEAIEVHVHPGFYPVAEPLVLTPEDSGSDEAPVIWRAADPGSKPVLSAGTLLNGTWETSDRPGVWQLDLPECRRSSDGAGWNFRQLFVEGRRATRARFPNRSGENPFLYATGGDYDHAVIDPALIKDEWLGEQDLQINLVVDWLFFNQWNTIASIDKSAGKLVFAEDERHGKVYKDNWFYVEGALVELDEPGEWYLDREEGRLFFMPEAGEDPNKKKFVAPRLDRIIHCKGDVDAGTHVKHVHFDGLSLRHTSFTLGHIAPRVHTDAALRLENTQDSSVKNCHFENIGGYACWLHLDSQRNIFARNTVLHSGGGGVLLTGSRLSYMDESKVYTPGEAASKVAPILNRITRNTVKHCGQIRYYGGGVHLDSRPAEMAMEPGNYIAHNEFSDLSRNGVFAFRNQGGNVVEYNHIHDAMQTTIDGACIHFATMNHLNAPNFILNNWLHDIWGFRFLPDQKPKRVLANGVFLDWDTSNTTVRDNFVYNSGGEPIKAIWENQNLTISGNKTSDSRIVPAFVDELGPNGTATHGIDLKSNRLTGGIVHHSDATLVQREGRWVERNVGGQGKLFSYSLLVADKGEPALITYTLPIKQAGNYRVSLLYKPDPGNATNSRVEVRHAEGTSTMHWNMTRGSKHGFSVEIGSFTFEPESAAELVLSNRDADGAVIADSVAFVRIPSINPHSESHSSK